ncbi:hypothetical protein GGH19_000244 [Coemansia sp. RSA 1807]|nr:hypothetical protein EV176_001141 [Coemansia sp. RSA 451]KAJ2446331.1 hypothetical protein IWW46_000985 [Coemansia sp. RSA 2440]KAJ2578714.1 hypothetical protein GGH19_000244 [Coemansia sp. RSA 1807]
MPLARRDMLDISTSACLKLAALEVVDIDYGKSECSTKYTEDNPYKADKETCSIIRSYNILPGDLNVICDDSVNKRSGHGAAVSVRRSGDYSSRPDYRNNGGYRANGPENQGSYGGNGPEHGDYDNGPEHSEHGNYGGNNPKYINNGGYNAYPAHVAPQY